jgi:hypothetical protein
VRLSKAVKTRLEIEAALTGLSPSEYMRSLLVAHLMSLVTRRNKGDLHSVGHRDLDRAVKEFILACQGPLFIATSLPGKEKRNSLEELAWKAVQDAVAYAKVQDDPELRLLAMRVASNVMRTELAILHDQDQAAVDEFLEATEDDRDELAKKTQESTRKKAPT